MIILETVLENWGAFAWASANTHISIRLEPACVDVSTIWRLLKVSNFTRWKTVMVWSDLLGAKYLNVFYLAIMRCWCLLMTQEQIQGIGQEGSLRKSLQFPRNSSYMPNSPKILAEKCIYYAVHVFLIMVVVTHELHHKINLVKHTDCNESEWAAFSTNLFLVFGSITSVTNTTSTADKMAQQTAADTPRAWAITIPPCQLRILDCYTVTGSNQRCSLEYLPCVHLCNNQTCNNIATVYTAKLESLQMDWRIEVFFQLKINHCI